MANAGNYGDFTYYLTRRSQEESREFESEHGCTPESQPTNVNQSTSPIQQPELPHASTKQSESHSQAGTPTSRVHRSLYKAKLSRLTEQMKKHIQTHAFASVGIAFGIGFVLARILKK